MAAGTPAKRTVRKQAPKKATAAAAQPAAAPAAGGAGEQPINEWLHDLQATPTRIQVFDRWWEFKPSTGGRALTWDRLVHTESIRSALASMMFDQTPSPAVTVTGPDGTEVTLPELPGGVQADAFLAAAADWVPPAAAEEFWRRMEGAIFGAGEASAS